MSGSAGLRPRTVADVMRGLGALVVLAVLLAGVPVALWVIDGSPVPASWPGVSDVWDTVTRPDDGTFFLDVLIFAGWVGWATFALSVVVEIPAAGRGMVAPRLPGLGAQQRLVASLIAAVATMVPAAQVATAGMETPGQHGPWEPAPPVTNELLDQQQNSDGADQGAPADGAGRGNADRADRGGRAGLAAPDSRRDPSVTHRVRPGETMWDIAGTTLGDPRRYGEIFDASVGTVQPDDRRLTDPDLIVPGWSLTIPGSAGPAGDGATEPASRGAADPDGDGAAATDERALADTGARASMEPPPPPVGQPRAESSAKVAAPVVGAVGGSEDVDCLVPDGEPVDATDGMTADAGVTEVDDEVDASTIVRTSGGVGAVLAAGLVGILAVRRTLRQRRRRAGERLVADAAIDRAAEVEMRHAADPRAVEFVDRALRTLSARLSGTSVTLPPLRAARLTGSALELYLAVPAEPPPPFVGTDQSRVWTVAVETAGVLDEEQANTVPAPYPSLVTIGHDSEDAHLLVDLEHLGSLTIEGPPDLTKAVMTAIAAEFATSRWADDIGITLVGGSAWADLHVLETGRVRRVADIDHVLDELTVRAADDLDLLTRAGVSGLGMARVEQVADAALTPEILLVADPLSPDQQRRLTAVTEATPRLAIAAVVAGNADGTGWALRVGGSLAAPMAVLDPLGMSIRPQLLGTATYQHVLNLLRNSDAGTTGEPRSEPDLREITVLPTLEHGPGSHAGDRPAEPNSTTSTVATAQAAPPTEPTAPGEPERSREHPAPRLIMLGRVEVVHAAELGERNKLGQLTELAMFIAMNPGCDASAIDEAIWPGSVVTKTTRNTAISKLRRWLGTDAHGVPLLPRTEGRYTFRPHVRSDWQDWCELLPDGPASASSDDLRAALALVKGRPFTGRGRRKYAWVDHHLQEMIAAIVDACHELAVRSLIEGMPRDAQRAAVLGLSIEPGVELLWRDRLKAEVLLGDRQTVLASIERLRSTADDLGGDLEDDTEELIEQIMKSGDRHPRPP